MLSSWDGETHKGPHFTLTVFPNGKTILTTPDLIPSAKVEEMARFIQRWLTSTDNYPLVIGDCVVHLTPVNPREFVLDVPE